MNEDNDKKLVEAFPLLYADRTGDIRQTLMPFGFECGDGWFNIVWELSSKLEPLIQEFIDENPNLECGTCGCEKSKHFGSKTKKPGKCLAIKKNYDSYEEPPDNYYACFCEEYRGHHPKAIQVKSKFSELRFYLNFGSDEMYSLIDKATAISRLTCEVCGDPGKTNEDGYWLETLCDKCRAERDSR